MLNEFSELLYGGQSKNQRHNDVWQGLCAKL